jgi:phosphatidylinositol kinase/protein kinase (PI-3  family)
MKKLNLWLRTYEILATGPRCGLIEAVSDSLSIDSIKKKIGENSRLIDYFYMQFGDTKSKSKFSHKLTLYFRIQEGSIQLLSVLGRLQSRLLHPSN